MITCMNCRYSRYYESGDFVIWHKDTLVCGVEGIAMDPNDSCNAFEPIITEELFAEALKNANGNSTEAWFNVHGYTAYLE